MIIRMTTVTQLHNVSYAVASGDYSGLIQIDTHNLVFSYVKLMVSAMGFFLREKQGILLTTRASS